MQRYENKVEYGSKLRKLRKKLGLSQNELAEVVSRYDNDLLYDRTRISKIENGVEYFDPKILYAVIFLILPNLSESAKSEVRKLLEEIDPEITAENTFLEYPISDCSQKLAREFLFSGYRSEYDFPPLSPEERAKYEHTLFHMSFVRVRERGGA
jgi:transcriptional regulator with XRE-family HTH domain